MFDWARAGKDAAAAALFLLVLAAVTWRTHTRVSPEGVTQDPVRTAMGDFREVVYYPTRAVLDGVNPYDNRTDGASPRYRTRYPVGNVFPLYHPLLFALGAPLAVLPLSIAELVFWLLNVGLLLALCTVAWRWSGIQPTIARVTLLAALLLLSRPGHANLYFGQITLLVTLASAAALHWARTRCWLAGAALAVATIKPTFGVPVALLMLARGDFRAASCGLFISSLTAAAGWGLIAAHAQPPANLLAIVQSNLAATRADPAVDPVQSGSRIDLPLAAERLLGPSSRVFSRHGLPLLLLVVAGVAAAHLCRESDPAARRWSDAIALITTAICIYHNIYDALLVALPAVWIYVALAERGNRPALVLPGVALAALCMPALNYLSSKQFLQLLQARLPLEGASAPAAADALWTLAAVANSLALLLAWSLLVATALRRRPAARAGLAPEGAPR